MLITAVFAAAAAMAAFALVLCLLTAGPDRETGAIEAEMAARANKWA